ncbi:MAG: iron-containing alcohol dehydrogenase [Planctomycetota bacterium]|nr:MAG: iron-containing alcohol dehydrogenase [Planctomycetota bacterium]
MVIQQDEVSVLKEGYVPVQDGRNWWGFACVPRIVFGRGSVAALEGMIKRRGSQRALLVTDATLCELGLVDRVKEPLRRAGCLVEVFDEGKPEPSTSLAASVAMLAASYRPDVWLALGGGSNMDLAKLACVLSAYKLPPASLFGFDTVPGPLPPLICLPTTAGTGSEVSHAAVLRNHQTGQKGGIVSEYLRPTAAVVDPSFTDSCPRELTAECGMDALTHAIEAALAIPYNHLSDDTDHGLAYEGNHPLGSMFAQRAIENIGACFLRVLADGQDGAARDGMALASTLAGLAFSSCGVSLVHALEYWVGSKYGCPHGVGNAILLPNVLRFYLPECADRIAEVGAWLGVLADKDPLIQAYATVETIERLRRRAGLPERLSQIGAVAEDLPGLARAAATLQRLIELAPKKVRRKDLLCILEASL